MPRLTSNISPFIVSQLPDYIRGDYITYASSNKNLVNNNSDYSKLINFLEAYYRFLEQEKNPQELLQNIKKYGDIDETIDTANVSLIKTFYKNYGEDIPYSLIENNRFFLKRLKDLFKTKGTEASFDLLFRVLFNIDVDLFYPGERVLKVSDGRWKTFKTIRVTKNNTANLFTLKNNKIIGANSGATAVVDNVLKIYDNGFELYELYLEKVKGSFNKEVIYSVKDNSIKANTEYQLISIDIVSGGLGYSSNVAIGYYGSDIKIAKVNDFGTIKQIDVLNPGYYFTVNNYVVPSVEILPLYTVNLQAPNKTLLGSVNFVSNVGVFTSASDHGYTTVSTANIYFFGNTNSIINQTEQSILILKILDSKRLKFALTSNVSFPLYVNSTTTNATLKYKTYANLRPNVSIVRNVPGFWYGSKGKMSDVNYFQGALRDSPDSSKLYYQPYSYVVKSERSFSDWDTIVLNTLHPAGSALFGEVQLNSDNNSNLQSTGTSVINDYLAITADSSGAIYNGNATVDLANLLLSRFGQVIDITADHVIINFGTL